MVDRNKMSVADMIAAARQADGEGAPGEPEPAAEEKPAVEAPSSADTPSTESSPAESSAPAPKLKPGERPSVADMLAMARADDKPGAKSAEPKAESKPKAAPKAKPAAKAAAKPQAAAPQERKDTASILAAARKGAKAGPITKAELAKQQEGKPKAPPKPKRPAPPMPEKPAYVLPVGKTDQGRREVVKAGFFASAFGAMFGTSMALGFTSLATATGLGSLGMVRFMFPNILTEPPSKFKVGFPGDFASGVVETKFKAKFGIWIVNYVYKGQQQLYALSTVCTHLGCTPSWLEAEQKFKCPCHGSGFYKDGVNFEGPAPRPLERFAISISGDGQVEIDKSKKFQEEMGQWEDSSSFVAV